MQGTCVAYVLADNICQAANQWRWGMAIVGEGWKMAADAGILLPRSRGMGEVRKPIKAMVGES
jgi:hypothetical protein